MAEAPRVQVVVAHPDDETFGCGSLLLSAAAAGAVRERELHRAAALLGVGRVDLLDFADSGMTGPAGPDTLAGAPFDAVVAAVREPMARFRPDVVVTLDASDGHRDHARIRDAASEAARSLGVPRTYLLCLPRSLMARWVEHMRADRPELEHLSADTTELGTPDEQLTTVIAAGEHLAARERAIAAHASQTSPFEGLPDSLRAAFLGTVHARRIHPPWPGGPPERTLFSELEPAP